jgi:hypothetical protein
MPNSKIHVASPEKGWKGAKHMGIDPIHYDHGNGIGQFRKRRGENSKFDEIMILLQIDDDADVMLLLLHK